jgi:hypothetical protein
MRRFMVIATIACLLPHVVRAQLARVGGEFQINTYGPGIQNSPHVARLPEGGFVVIWNSERQDGDGAGVFGKVFGADGQPLSPEFQVNTTTIGDQQDARLAAFGDGTFVVMWSQFAPYPETIMGQRFDPAGDPLGSEFEVVDDEFRDIFALEVAAAAGNEFVVVWGAEDGLDDHLIRGRILTSDAQPIGPSFSISSLPVYEQGPPAVASGPDDSLIVVWYSDRGTVISGRIFDARLQPIGPAFTIADVTARTAPQICSHEDGTFVVTWSDYAGSPLRGEFVMYRRYDKVGNALTPALRTTTDQPSRQVAVSEFSPTLSCGPQRQTVLVWNTLLETRGLGIRGRVFLDDSLPDSSEFRISSGVIGSRSGSPAVAMLDTEDFILTWNVCRGRDDDDCDVFGQRFTLRGPTDCVGDCDHNGVVTVDELLTAVNIALDSADVPMNACLPADANLDYSVSIDELVTAVDHALRGCS